MKLAPQLNMNTSGNETRIRKKDVQLQLIPPFKASGLKQHLSGREIDYLK
jgi:hypothetical protein